LREMTRFSQQVTPPRGAARERGYMQDTAAAKCNRRVRYILMVERKTTDLFHDSILLQRFEYRVCTVNSAGQAIKKIRF